VNPHSVFLRSGCILPDRLNFRRQPYGDGWSVVEEFPALIFDTMVRQAGWHFIWLQGACSRWGFGLSQEVAFRRGLLRALGGVSKRFNAAELDSIQFTQYPGFQIAIVTVQPLQIQESAKINNAAEQHQQPAPAR
jgi:hypothetical protein